MRRKEYNQIEVNFNQNSEKFGNFQDEVENMIH